MQWVAETWTANLERQEASQRDVGSCTMDRVSARPDEVEVEEVEMQPAAQLLGEALHQPVGRVPPGSAGAGGAAVEGAHACHALQALVQAPIRQVAGCHRNLQRGPPCHDHNGPHDIYLYTPATPLMR